MSVTGSLFAFGFRYVFNVSADAVVGFVEKRMTDHSRVLPKALTRANERAWQAVGLALGSGGLFGRLKGLIADGDLKAVRDHVREFLDHTPTGIEDTSDDVRRKCLDELGRLRASGRLTALPAAPDLAR